MLTPVRQFHPEQPPQWPYRFVIERPARWPAGRHWRLRSRLAAPLRAVARGFRAFAAWATWPVDRLARDIEGQPYGVITEQECWRQRYLVSELRWAWVYEGPITPAIRQMFASHPERFADSGEAVRAALGAIR